MLKAISTRYNGRLFRSRLEARWAVFFDYLGIKYEYEHEGFSLPSGCYLPDFYFREFNCYGEVKPIKLNEAEMLLAEGLSSAMLTEDGSVDIILLEGLPENRSYRTIIDGNLGYNVLITSKDQKIHPFFTYDQFIDWTFLKDTKDAVLIANEYQFEHGKGLK